MPCQYCFEAPDEGKCIRDGCAVCCECGRQITLPAIQKGLFEAYQDKPDSSFGGSRAWSVIDIDPRHGEDGRVVAQNMIEVDAKHVALLMNYEQAIDNLKDRHQGPNGTWGEVPDYPVPDWQHLVANGDTRQGYWDYAYDELQQAADEATS